MKYKKDERLDIGRRIYDGEISTNMAAEKYNINPSTARGYMHLYRNTEHLPPKKYSKHMDAEVPSAAFPEEYAAMSREELIQALAEAKVSIARLKKGYEVKGAGAGKEYILLGNANTR